MIITLLHQSSTEMYAENPSEALHTLSRITIDEKYDGGFCWPLSFYTANALEIEDELTRNRHFVRTICKQDVSTG